MFAEAERLRGEWVIRVSGSMRPRPAGTANANLTSGAGRAARARDRGAEPFGGAAVPARRGRQGRDPAQVPLSRSAARRDAAAAAAAACGDARDARVSRRSRLHRSRDADADQGDAGGRARLPGAEPHAAREVLRAAAVAADLQAAADDVGLRSLLPDRALLPRRGPARRPAAGVHAARRRDLVPDARRDHGPDGRARAPAVPRGARRLASRSLPAHDLRRGDAALRLGQARPARAARARRRWRPGARQRVQGVRGARDLGRRPRGGAARARGWREALAQADRRLHGLRRALRRQGSRLRQGQRRGARPRRPAVADPQVPVGRRDRGNARAHRRAAPAT